MAAISRDSGELYRDLPDPYGDINFFYREKGWSLQAHYHSFYQMILVTEGLLTLKHNNIGYQLRKGQFCIIPPRDLHALETETGYSQFGINLKPEADQRGIMSLLLSHIDDFIILDKSELLDVIPQLRRDCAQLTTISKLKAAGLLDSILIAYVESTLKEWEIDFRNNLLGYLNRHLSERITLQDLSSHMAVSPSQLERMVNQEFGCGAIELFNRLRINKACTLLRNSNRSLKEISDQLGFYDQSHFSHYFRQKTSFTPSGYRSQQRMGESD